jgi:hypothetical protein
MRRYDNTQIFGNHYGTSDKIAKIRKAMSRGDIEYREVVLKDGERLDTLAGKEYGDGKLFWLIACASSIGYCLQVPPGTIIKIPSIRSILKIL